MRAFCLVVAGAGFGHFAKEAFNVHDSTVALAAVAALLAGWRWNIGSGPRYDAARAGLWLVLPIAVWGLYAYLIDYFGFASIGGFLFHLQMGAEGKVDPAFAVAAAKYAALIVAVCAAVAYLCRRDPRGARHAGWWAAVLLVCNPFVLRHPFWSQPALAFAAQGKPTRADLASRYTAVPERPAGTTPGRNLILIYVESIERTFSDPVFGDAYAPFANLAARGIEFTGIEQVENTGWTMAGIFASQCGVPLMPLGIMTGNAFRDVTEFAPGVRCLPQILEGQGYVSSYVGGADLDFAGKRKFLGQHGYTRMLGEDELAAEATGEDLNRWGLNDDRMFERAADEVRTLRVGGQPYLLTILTLSAHFPNGFPARACESEQGRFDGQDILYSVRCTANLTSAFIDRLGQEGLLENTALVVMSDHLSMKNSAWSQLERLPRRNTFIVLDPARPATQIGRAGSTLDVFPTLLDVLGYPLDADGRAGLGVSLLRPTPTLVESLGSATVNASIAGDPALTRLIWESATPEP